MRYFEKRSGTQAELYKTFKPVITKMFNIRNSKDMSNWVVDASILRSPATERLKDTLFKNTSPGPVTQAKLLISEGRDKIQTALAHIDDVISRIPGGLHGSNKYVESKSRTYPNLKGMFDDKEIFKKLKIETN